MKARKSDGQVVLVVMIRPNKPFDQTVKEDSVAFLSDGTWEYVWNLQFIAADMNGRLCIAPF